MVKYDVSQARGARRWWIALWLLCLVSFVSLGGDAWRAWRVRRRGVERPGVGHAIDTRLGVNVALAQYDADALERVLADIAALDWYWLRQSFSWRAIEPRPGIYDWARWDAIIDAVQRHHLGLIAVLDDPPPWAARQSEFPLPCAPPYDEAAYARFASALAARYGAVIDHYQVWDEPNLSRRWGGGHVAPCGYMTLLQAAYPAIHAADATAWVLGGGLAPTQAPGPDNLNDLVYLRRLYAAGGGAFFDLLAARLYGFWSGADDRRVAADTLNFSRLVAVREVMHEFGDADRPVWAVAWGWNVRPAGGAATPWGGDEIEVQQARIFAAVRRARVEWPWLGPMCWAEYQPDLPQAAPRQSFALRDAAYRATPLYHTAARLQEINEAALAGRAGDQGKAGMLRLAGAALVAAAGLAAPWFFPGWRKLGWAVWGQVDSLPGAYRLGAAAALAGLYALAPRPEWAALAWIGAGAMLGFDPRRALIGAILCLPFFYGVKITGAWRIAPAEPLLWMAVVGFVARRFWRQGWAWHSLSWFDLLWGLWAALGLAGVFVAPDRAAAWREWRLSMLEPALLYALLRGGALSPTAALSAWVVSGGMVALIGVGQWALGQGVARVTSVYYSPNHLALYLERTLPVALAWGMWGSGKKWARRLAWGMGCVSILGLYLTYSRGAWLLAMPVMAAVLAWSGRRHVRRWTAAAGGAALALAGVYVGIKRTALSLSFDIRTCVWASALEMAGDHLWRGVGLAGFQFVYPRYMRASAWTEPLLYHPHNMWLDAVVQLGVPGLVVFALLAGGGVWQTARLARSHSPRLRAIGIGLLAGLLGAWAHGLVDSGYFLTDLASSFALVVAVAQSLERR